MRLTEIMPGRLPRALRDPLLKYREFFRFAAVGAVAYSIDTLMFIGLKLTILAAKPVTAKVVAVLIATIVSYVLNREWSFRSRGGRERRHEAALFFAVSGVGLVLSAAPLWFSRYALDLQAPAVGRATQEIADFVSAQIVGTALAMVFRYWAMRRYVFPDELAGGDCGPGQAESAQLWERPT